MSRWATEVFEGQVWRRNVVPFVVQVLPKQRSKLSRTSEEQAEEAEEAKMEEERQEEHEVGRMKIKDAYRTTIVGDLKGEEGLVSSFNNFSCSKTIFFPNK